MENAININPREFEVLAANYAKFIAPNYQWRVTKQTVDFNRDFEALVNETHKWGEAKLTYTTEKVVSKIRWDPTLLSAILRNNVDELFLVTSGWIPIEYVVRACHFIRRSNNIKRILFTNGFMINEWLNERKGKFDNFSTPNVDLNKKPIKFNSDFRCYERCNIDIFDMFNILEPESNLCANILYEIDVTFFTKTKNDVEIIMPDCFEIHDIKMFHLSKTKQSGENNQKGQHIIRCKSEKGYNQVVIIGKCNYIPTLSEQYIKVEIEDVGIFTCSLKIQEMPLPDDNVINAVCTIENARDISFSSKKNFVVEVENISRNDISRIQNYRFYYFSFGTSYCENAIEACRIISLLIFGFNNRQSEQKNINAAINSTLNYHPTWQTDILMGTSDYVYAISALKELLRINATVTYLDFNFVTPKEIAIFIDNINKVDLKIKDILNWLFNIFKMHNNSSLIILNKCKNNIAPSLETTPRRDLINTIDIIHDRRSMNNCEIEQVLNTGNEYYYKSEFFKAKFFYDLVFQMSPSIKNDLFSTFNYADILNHCGEMIKAKELFTSISIMESTNELEEKKILEARTELFNLRFWLLEVNTLVDDINQMIIDDSQKLENEMGDPRDLYAYYNCLNRKMVTQYLLGDYKNAEITFMQYLDSINSEKYINYKAFAYMDSARGLYSHDRKTAKIRLKYALEILRELYDHNRERRRYLDCVVEWEYINFILNYENGKDLDIQPLETAVANVRIHGFKSMLIKCNLKLAACYLAKGDIATSRMCLNYIKGSCDFSENPRVEIQYDNLLSGLYYVKRQININKYEIAKDYSPERGVSFDHASSGKFYLDPRLW